MSVLTFTSELLTDAELLQRLSPELFNDFLTFALESITGETIQPKIYNRAASALDVEPMAVQKAISALASILVVAAKKNATIQLFEAAITDLCLSSENVESLIDCYKDKSQSIRTSLGLASKIGTHYHQFNWRLDVEISSSTVRNSYKPQFLIELLTKSNVQSTEKRIVTADYAMLQKMNDELTIAVNEGKNAHARRIMRYVK